MKKSANQILSKLKRMLALVAASILAFVACTKNSTTVNTGPQLPAEAIRGTVLNGGNIKGVMLADSTYTVNGDLTVLPPDTLTIQAGAKINVTGNHAFYIQGIIQSLGTQAKPIVFTSTVAQQPGQWGGFQADSAKSVTFYWTKLLWAGGPDSTGGTRQTIAVSSPIPVDIEDCWFVGGQDNSIGVYSTATVKILRNSFYGNGTTDGDCIDFHSGVTGTVAYNVLWGSAGSAIKVYTSQTTPLAETNVDVYNNTCVESGFRRGANEPGRGILVDAFSKARVYNNLLVNNYWSLDISSSSDYANTKYGNNYFYVTVDSLRQFMYPQGSMGMIQPSDILDSVHTGANDPKFVGYFPPPDPSNRIIPANFDFRLQPGSPALGKGNSTYSNDIGAYVTDTSGGKGNRHPAGY
jgi:hypothetical protein